MIEAQKATDLPPILQSTSISTSVTSATNSVSFDTWVKGEPAAEARLTFSLPAAQATNSSAKFVALTVGHAATTHVSNATTLTVGGTGTTNSTASASQFVMPAHNDTSNRSVYVMDVHLGKCERYIHISHEDSEDLNTCIFTCSLSRIGNTPTDATAIARSASGGYNVAQA